MNKEGFTLLELLVVITIISILSSIALVNLKSAKEKGQDDYKLVCQNIETKKIVDKDFCKEIE